MSQTIYVEYRENGFWAFDVVLGVFLKHLIDAATRHLGGPEDEWLSGEIPNWRINAVISDFALILDANWSEHQIRTFNEIAAEACRELQRRETISAEEIASWPMVDDLRIFPRGLPLVTTASVVRLGKAMIELVNGSLSEPPPGTRWLFSYKDDPSTIRMRKS